MNTEDKIHKRTIAPNASLLDAMKKMDASCVKTLLVFEGSTFLGMLTIGDIQRNIIKNISLNRCIKDVLNNDKIYASPEDSLDSIKKQMENLRAECMPVVDKNGDFVKAYFWSDFFKTEKNIVKEKIDLPVVIMAGGKGTRLKPITNVVPKPLIPIGDKTILEEIMDQFEGIGCKQFYMSVNYKSDMMRFYLDQLDHSYNIEFFEESMPMGTIGSVSLLRGKINTPFFVSNCDIIIDQDYRDVYDYHKTNNNDITIVTAVKSTRIPYGVIETGENGLMTGLKEKPEKTYMINTGVYVLNSDLIDEIPENTFFHITDLMEKVKNRGGRVGCFPVSEGAWRDMGEWPEYLKMIKVL